MVGNPGIFTGITDLYKSNYMGLFAYDLSKSKVIYCSQ